MPISRSGDEGGDPHLSKWPYFKPLLFLKDIVKVRVSSGNCTKQKLEKADYVNPEGALDDDGQAEAETDDVSNQGSSNLNAASETLPSPVRQKRKRDTSSWNDRMLCIEEKKLALLERKSKRTGASEGMLHFFKSLMPHVEKIPANRELAFRRRVEDLVDEFAYGIKPSEPLQILEPAIYSSPSSSATFIYPGSNDDETPNFFDL